MSGFDVYCSSCEVVLNWDEPARIAGEAMVAHLESNPAHWVSVGPSQ